MLKKNLVANLLNQILGVGFPIITQIYLVRHLSLTDIGFWNVLLAVQSIVVLCSSLTTLYAIRVISGTEDVQRQSLYVTHVLGLDYALLIGPLSVGLLYLLLQYPAEYHIILVCFLPLLTTPLAAEYYFQATLKNDFILYRRLFARTVFLILLFAFVHDPSSFLIFAYIASLTTALEHIINFALVRRLLNRRLFSLPELAKTLRNSIGYLPFNLTYNTLPQVSILVGARLLQSDALAVFSILMKLVNLATTFVSSSVMVIFPYRLRRQNTLSPQKPARDDYGLYFLLTALVATIVVIVLIASTDLIVLLFLNNQTAGFNRSQFAVLACYVVVHSVYNYVVFNHFFERARVKEVIITNLLIIAIFLATAFGSDAFGLTPSLSVLVVVSALFPAGVVLAASFRDRRTVLSR